MGKECLKFKVAPHIVQDLGLNLYTTLSRVLVEFVANAYDADSPSVVINLDKDKINAARKQIQEEWKKEVAAANACGAENGLDDSDDNPELLPLGQRSLPDDIEIVIADEGFGMSRDDLQKKFLVAGRRRREEERQSHTPNGRLLMGRKGLGKLAGFGIAHRIVVVTKKESDDYPTKITLDYEELLKNKEISDIPIQEEKLYDGGGLGKEGTRVVLSRLVYEPMKSREQTIANAIGDHFAMVDADDFAVTLNGEPAVPTPRVLAFAWPNPDLDKEELVEDTYTTDDNRKVVFQYRIRFTGPGQHLSASERGVRVYAHKRLAAASSLLDVRTGIHGFRNTEYLDGVVYADFVDDEEGVDYIATDRHTLRWDSYLLSPMKDLLSDEMIKACNEYQKKKDADAETEAKEDKFTKDQIDSHHLPKHRQKLAYRVAGLLAPVCQDGKEGDDYKQRLLIFLDGLGQGDILKALADLAQKRIPEFDQIIARVAELTAQEFGDFARSVQGRLDGIAALQKLYTDTSFKAKNNEDKLHSLFNKCPWLIDPTFTQFLTSNQTENELNVRLSRYLEIGQYVSAGYDPTANKEVAHLGSNKRPDLVFLLSNEGLQRIVVIELKAPNTPLHNEHLTQLKGYVRRTKKFLREQGGDKARYRVEGYLIGSKADPDSKSEEVEQLRYEIEQRPLNSEWMVYDIGEVLDRSKLAHQELINIYDKAKLSAENEEPV